MTTVPSNTNEPAYLAESSRRERSSDRQMPRRQGESDARRRAAMLAERAGISCREAARQLCIAPRTLTHWRQACEQGGLDCRLRGRPCKQSSLAERRAVVDLLDQAGPRLGLPSLRAFFPALPRCELADLQADYHRWWRRRRVVTHELDWTTPGRVWAMDHARPPVPLEGTFPAVLAVRDLASGMQLAWLPVQDETAETTCRAIETLFREHGPPLVLKSDNGSPFKSRLLAALLAVWQVAPLRSPPYNPSYNGSCEAAIGAFKLRTHIQAALARQSRSPTSWNAGDLEAARRWGNEIYRPASLHGATRQQLWNRRSAIQGSERTDFETSAAQFKNALADVSPMPTEVIIQRRAVRRALVELGLLLITRRLITPPLRSSISAKIS